MAKFAELTIPEEGSIVANITHFARALRKAGLPVGTGRLVGAIRAVDVVGFTEKRDFFWTLHACFVSRPEHRDIFAQVFRLYWRDPQYLENIMAMFASTTRGIQEEHSKNAAEQIGRAHV